MATADLIQELNQDLLDAYAAIEAKGGTVPAEKNSNALAEAISTITGGEPGPGPEPEPDPYYVPYFDGGEYGAVAYLDGNEDVQYHYFTADEEHKIAAVDISSSRINIVVDGEQINKNRVVAYSFGTAETAPGINDSGVFYDCQNLRVLYNLEKANGTTVGDYFCGSCRVLNCPLKFSPKVTSVRGNVLIGCYSFNSTITLPEGVTSIGGYFLQNGYAYNKPIILPSTIKTIGTYFLYGCHVFNSSISLPKSLESIGSYFLYNNYSFNQPLLFSGPLNSIGSYFLSNCHRFNQTVSLPEGLARIDEYFMSACDGFNQPLTIPSTVTSIQNYFLYECRKFNAPLTFSTPSSIKTINSSVLSGCYNFNQPIEIPDSVTAIYDSFLRNCYAFNSKITFSDNCTQIGGYFLSSDSSFNQSLELPSSLTSIGRNFLSNALSFNGKITWRASREEDRKLSLDINFLAGCESFNQSINEILAVTTSFNTATSGADVSADDGFMVNCKKFNQPIVFNPNFTSFIPAGFLHKCVSFNSPITFPESISGIYTDFLKGCISFNQPITMPTITNASVTYNCHNLLRDCTSFNQPINFSADDKHTLSNNIFAYFLRGCTSFNSKVTFTGQPKGTLSFYLYGCDAYNQPVVLPESITGVNYFLCYCDSFNSTIEAPGVTALGSSYLSYNKTIKNNVPYPENAATVSDRFLANSQVEQVVIPDTIKSIGTYFLSDCRELKEVVFEGTPTITSSTSNIGMESDSANAYAYGVLLSGPNAEAMIGNFSYRSSSPFRRVYLESDTVLLYYVRSNGVTYRLTTRNDLNTFKDTWCNRGISGTTEIHYQPGVATLDDITTLPISYDFLSYCRDAQIDGLQYFTHLTRIGNSFLYAATNWDGVLPDLSNVTSIGNYFGYSNTPFKEELKLGDSLTSIGSDFLENNSNYTYPLTLPDSVTNIGNYFLYNCYNFTGPLNVGKSSGIYSGQYMLSTGSATALEYTEGITLTGANAEAWKMGLPDRTTNPYRKLIIANS